MNDLNRPQRPALQLQLGPRLWQPRTPVVMGIVNVTPDSFSDGGRFQQREAAVARALQLHAEGAGVIDLGGESTRPGAQPVSPAEELARVLPVVQALAAQPGLVLSIDTSSPEVFAACWAVTPCLWNDVRALTRPGARALAARLDCPVVLMHNRGEPDRMGELTDYPQGVVDTVCAELQQQVALACAAGVRPAQMVLDPGFGFAKTTAQNLQLLAHLPALQALGHPLLIGLSRKRMLGEVLGGAPVDQRVHAGVAAAVWAVSQGAVLVRTHDVAPTVQALRLLQAVQDHL